MRVDPTVVTVESGPGKVPERVAVRPVRLNRGEYWLLREAVFLRLPLWSVALPEGEPWRRSIEMAFNHPGHGLSREELARTLRSMARRGWIRLYRHGDDGPSAVRLRLSEGAIAAEFDRPDDDPIRCLYELTPLGGRIWEQFARPEWHRYVDDEGEPGDGPVSGRRIVAANRRQLMSYLHAVRAEVDVIAGSECCVDIDDWTPAYWKPAMPGVRCTLRCVDKPLEARREPGTEHYHRVWCHW
jgi:hypothetical protein